MLHALVVCQHSVIVQGVEYSENASIKYKYSALLDSIMEHAHRQINIANGRNTG